MKKLLLYDPTRLKDVPYVTSPISFERAPDGELTPVDTGIFSNVLFGTSPTSRKKTRAKIALNGTFLSPLVYTRVFARMGESKMKALISKEGYFKFEKGELVPCDESDKDSFTGLSEFKKNLDYFKPKKGESFARNNLIDFLKATKQGIFVESFSVIPPFYRDVKITATGMTSDPVNKMYETLISYTSALKNMEGLMDTSHLNLKIQLQMVEIYKYFRNMYKGKKGVMQSKLMGRPVNYTGRTVISSPEYLTDVFGDGDVNTDRYLYPLDIAMGLFQPFVIFNMISFMKEEYGVEVSPSEVEKLIVLYSKSYAHRLKPAVLNIINDEGVSEERTFEITYTKDGSEVTTPLSLIELCYIVTTRATVNKHVVNTRFPVLKTQNTLTVKVGISTTIKVTSVSFKGEQFRRWPVIEEGMEYDKILAYFEQTLKIPCDHLGSYDGDFDKQPCRDIGEI